MTLIEIVDYYADLLIIQYRNKPKARGTVKAFVSLALAEMLPVAVQNAFDPNNSVGNQLNILGKYIGVRRSYPGIELTDEEMRILMNLAIIKNFSNGSLASIDDMVSDLLEDKIRIYDYKTMNMGIYLDYSLGTDRFLDLIIDRFLPIPMAVGVDSNLISEGDNPLLLDRLNGLGDVNDPNVGGLFVYFERQDSLLGTQDGLIIVTQDEKYITI